MTTYSFPLINDLRLEVNVFISTINIHVSTASERKLTVKEQHFLSVFSDFIKESINELKGLSTASDVIQPMLEHIVTADLDKTKHNITKEIIPSPTST